MARACWLEIDMAFLIVDPNKAQRESAAAMIKWVDRRHRIDFADTGSEGLSLALRQRHSVAFILPKLSDFSGEQLCIQLHQRLPQIQCVALSNESSLPKGFDFILSTPPSRLDTLNIIERAKGRKKRTQQPEPHEETSSRRIHLPFFDPTRTTISVYVEIFDDPLKFTVPIPTDSSLKELLEQLGKEANGKVTLIRDGKEIDAKGSTPLQELDRLIFRVRNIK